MRNYAKPLFIFEVANNHQGSLEHGTNIIKELKRITDKWSNQFDFAVKFQYRDLDTFIRPDYKGRTDIKNVKRFEETRLSSNEYLQLKETAQKLGFITICTPFDESSVDLIQEHHYNIIKIASCSFPDWPLLEKIAEKKMPVIASVAGSDMTSIHKVVSFFRNRDINLSIMHCVAEYPTVNENLQMNQIDLLQNQYPDITVGFSTHESPDNQLPIRIAIAKGARIFEKHVGLPTETIALNSYSASPEQVDAWLQAAKETFDMCGVTNERYTPNEKEINDLAALKRGVFVKERIKAGEQIKRNQVYFAFPCEKEQLLSEDFSKYNIISAQKKFNAANEPIYLNDIVQVNDRKLVENAVRKVMQVIKGSHVVIPKDSKCSLSHHYGIEKYSETGVAIIDCVNREYCKKILVVLPGQNHPSHYHLKKEETFTVLWGELDLEINGIKKRVYTGEQVLIERGKGHAFSSECGCVFEEISTTHCIDDSYYNTEGFVEPRKTNVFLTQEWIDILRD